MRLATRSFAQSIVDLRDALARWQVERSIQQWRPGEVDVNDVFEQVSRDEWWVDSTFGAIRAAIRLSDTDDLVWPHVDDGAGYVHGLMVARNAAGIGLGSQTLSWAEKEIANRGLHIARLDCVATNAVLRSFYLEHGFLERGIMDFGSGSSWHPVMRFEKRLS